LNTSPRKKKVKAEVSEQHQDQQEVTQTTESGQSLLTSAVPTPGFPIVGIGASAGGLEAFQAFFSAMPTDSEPRMAFVLVQHLSPAHRSLLVELVKRFTKMPVFEVEDGMVPQPGCIYIIPPNKDMAFLNGSLQLLEPVLPRGQHLPIDFFFRSLAQDQHERAICIVLSGTGRDGTLGVRAVKGEGGMVMAQSPETAEFDGMPVSVIDTGMVDYILPVSEMPAKLIGYVKHVFGHTVRSHVKPVCNSEDLLKKVFILLRDQTGHDFSLYKHNTINRRLERRMALHQIAEIAEYVRFLQQTPAEVKALFQEMLIGVTSFFRDTEAFAAIQSLIIPQLFAEKPSGSTIRVWTCGCSTGEEAFSLAILIQEEMEARKQYCKVQLFATDIDARAIEVARSGVYPTSIAVDVSAERLSRFFTLQGDGTTYRVTKPIRDMVIFSEHDVIKDPPFSKLDLITCRNLLIYMGIELQKKLIPVFHYALRTGGMLFLGSSETVGEFEEIFTPLNRQLKLYLRKEDIQNTYRPVLKHFFTPQQKGGGRGERGGVRSTLYASEDKKMPLRELTEKTLLQHFAAVGVLVSEHGEIFYLHGRTGRFLEPTPGEASLNILKMAREGLQHELVIALYKAVTQKERVFHPALQVKTNGSFTCVNMTVLPVFPDSLGHLGLAPELSGQTWYLVILEDAPLQKQGQPAAPEPVGSLADSGQGCPKMLSEAVALREELRIKEEYLQRNIEELDTSNEEMQSINEELQSTNEELETSQEELQSVNEELATVNAELQAKVVDLSRANNDMNNLLAGTDLGMIFVDHHLCVQRFTPAVTKVINLIPTDVGRPVAHIVSNLVNYDSLVADVQDVLDTLIPQEIEVCTGSGEWFLLRIRPYRTLENVIEGAVITFIDFTERKCARENAQRLAVIVENAQDAILLQDLKGRILAWNPAAQRMYGWSEAEALAMHVVDLIPEEKREEHLAMVQQLLHTENLEPYRSERIGKNGERFQIWLVATPMVDKEGKVYAVATTARKIMNGKPV